MTSAVVPMRQFSLRGKVYIVTGGGRGLGLCMAEAMTEAGAEVHCLDRLQDTDSEFLATQELACREHIGSLHYHHLDVRDSERLQETIRKIASRQRRLDGLVAAAGILQLTDAIDYSPEDVTKTMDINYTGLFMTAQAVARQMMEYECVGSIVLVASMSGLVANKGMNAPVYNSSKAAVIQLGKNLAMEWGQKGIRVNSLCPGHILTPMVQQTFEKVEGLWQTWESENMLGRLAKPVEFTGAAIFLLSEASRFMTGSSLVIDGGHTAW
ncbi:alcohol dehydrogenase [Blastomyces dermatitidis ATCC 18188]|uniref:Alcohol dehydrogenase n=1 Tax=Ajellomyces dermatitidis (strain ATCC 18188 / CBS 674.68) TaxID=653446 RepID=F2T4T4_AJEDA|nr:alcohol dehydrogenase [Blastomyces dermatitidis ATCC 18188]